MAFDYSIPQIEGYIRQGEILVNLVRHVVNYPYDELQTEPEVTQSVHPFLLVISQDCDLSQDFRGRYPDSADFGGNEARERRFRDEGARYLLDEMLVCVGLTEDEIRVELPRGGDIFKSARRNQLERYHRIEGRLNGSELVLFFDFKRLFSLRTDLVYQSVLGKGERRLAQIPEVYMLDLIHRCHSFLSRVALPEE